MDSLSIQSCLQKLENGVVGYSRAGGGVGSILLIETDKNVSLWVWCHWEIMKSKVILATADDDTTAVVGKIAVAARQLEGKRVNRVELSPSSYDLHIFFEEGYELRINCESQPEEESYPLDNWELQLKDLDTCYTITCDLTIKEERYY